MSVATVTSKGQTTIPKDIRKHLGLHTGDKLRFLVETDGRVVILPATLSVRDLKGSLPKPAEPVSLEAMDAAVKTRSKP